MKWQQHILKTKQKIGNNKTTLTVWVNEHGELDMDNVDLNELDSFLVALTKGHICETEEGETIKTGDAF